MHAGVLTLLSMAVTVDGGVLMSAAAREWLWG